jgi:anaerobic ribonucleoside-triphosphate reductase activating protein
MDDVIRIAGIVEESFVDGPGIRFVVFAQGCKHSCEGCHNPHTHDFNGGMLVSTDDMIEKMKKNPLLDGITLSGGEPFEQAKGFGMMALKAKQKGYHVMTYSGYLFEDIIDRSKKDQDWKRLLLNTDALVDGKFEADKKDLLLKFRGSKNQRIIDVGESIDSGSLVILD